MQQVRRAFAAVFPSAAVLTPVHISHSLTQPVSQSVKASLSLHFFSTLFPPLLLICWTLFKAVFNSIWQSSKCKEVHQKTTWQTAHHKEGSSVIGATDDAEAPQWHLSKEEEEEVKEGSDKCVTGRRRRARARGTWSDNDWEGTDNNNNGNKRKNGGHGSSNSIISTCRLKSHLS